MILFCFFVFFRVAGTVGAIVTCPLEVVKTRLQSSSAFLYPPRVPDQQGKSSPKSSKGILRPEQRRQLCNTLLRKRPQVTYLFTVIYLFALRSN